MNRSLEVVDDSTGELDAVEDSGTAVESEIGARVATSDGGMVRKRMESAAESTTNNSSTVTEPMSETKRNFCFRMGDKKRKGFKIWREKKVFYKRNLVKLKGLVK